MGIFQNFWLRTASAQHTPAGGIWGGSSAHPCGSPMSGSGPVVPAEARRSRSRSDPLPLVLEPEHTRGTGGCAFSIFSLPGDVCPAHLEDEFGGFRKEVASLSLRAVTGMLHVEALHDSQGKPEHEWLIRTGAPEVLGLNIGLRAAGVSSPSLNQRCGFQEISKGRSGRRQWGMRR